jgi:hypothetical protein
VEGYKFSEWVTFGKKPALDKELMQQALDAHRSGRFYLVLQD